MNESHRRVLIAGGTGFLGEAVRNDLREAGYNVRLLVRSSRDAETYQDLGFETALGDVVDPQSLVIAMDSVDCVINLVAIIKESGEATFERINFQGSVNLVNAARQASVHRLIKMSALGAGNLPDFPYFYTKWRAETYVQDHIPNWTIMRPSIIFGPSSEGHYQFVAQLADLLRSAPVTPVAGDGRSLFQPIHTLDVAAAFTRAVEDESTFGQIYDLAGPEVLTYREILDEVARTLDIKKPSINVPVPLIRLGISIMNPLPFIEPPVTHGQLDMLQIDNTTNDNAAPRLLERPLHPFIGGLDFLRTDY
ncbi:complex I NDUFA9 subunit family protein [soil metagenome]